MRTLTLGVIGDFGIKSENSSSIATLVKSWEPLAIVTTGDNIYSPPTLKNYSTVVGGLYKEYLSFSDERQRILKKPRKVFLLRDKYHKAKPCNTKFLPCVGNHDYPFDSYIKYFSLPTYYSVELIKPDLPANFLKIISLNQYQEVDGRFDSHLKTKSSNLIQHNWLVEELEQSHHFKWIIVTFHYPQLCSNSPYEENEVNLKRLFPFNKYKNVALVLSGHQHIYERLELNGITNVVVGTSGHSVRRRAAVPQMESKVLDDSGYGALRLDIDEEEIKGSYYVLEWNRKDRVRERETVVKDQFTVRLG